MSIAGIEKVRAAETEADEMRKSAEDEAAQIIASGKKEARAILDEAEGAGSGEYKAVMAEAEEEAARLYQERIDREQAACEKIRADARRNMDAAVDLIVGKVVGTYGNS
jgi:V/A-type H+-transporting ATPase subunit G/H